MGLLRFIFTYLVRNEHLINKLADSKPIRRSAQIMAYLLLRIRSRALPFESKEYVKPIKDVTDTLKEKLQKVKDELKKNVPK